MGQTARTKTTRKNQTRSKVLLRILREKTTVTIDSKSKDITILEFLTRRLINSAAEGTPFAVELLHHLIKLAEEEEREALSFGGRMAAALDAL